MRSILLIVTLLLAAPLTAAAQPAAVSDGDRAEADAIYERGREQFEAGQVAIAAAHFRAALELDPSHQRSRAYLVECLVVDGDLTEARRVAEGGVPAAPVAPSDEAATQSASPGPVPPSAPAAPPVDAPLAPIPEEGEATRPAPASAVVGAAAESAGAMTEAEAAARRAEAARIQAAAQARNAERAQQIDEARRAEAAARRVQEEERAAAQAQAQAAARAPAARAERRARRNPRATSRIAAGGAIGGAAITGGAFVELRPTWLGAFDIGIGGFFVPGDGVRGAVAFSLEAQLSPVPWRLTPLFGAGLMVLGGPAVDATDGVLASLPSVGQSRVIPYGLLGVRYDVKKRLWFSVSARLAPSPTTVVMPIPGMRIGLRF
jgi:hypothetical protein